MTDDDYSARYDAAFMSTYGPPQRTFVRGDGSWLYDAEGKRYLDLLGGLAVNVLGHGHPAWVRAVSEQAATLAHVSNFFSTPSQIALAERVLEIADAPRGSRVFLCNSGTEANEAALKMARKSGGSRVVALEGSFHGRTMGALAVTHKPAIREPFVPLPGEVTFVPTGDIAALEAAMAPDATGERVGALILEPIQGESGVRPVADDFLAAARRLCDATGALLILDEVQTGIGRTGLWFAFQGHGVRPDVLTMAKGLAGGFPIGAVVAFGERVAGLFAKGDHGTTFGGNPLACAAAVATLTAIGDEGLLENAKSVGVHLREGALAIPGVTEVRGEGLMLGIGLERPVAAEAVPAALDAGFVINAPNPSTIRLLPALNLSAEQADLFLAWLEAHLTSAPSTSVPPGTPKEAS